MRVKVRSDHHKLASGTPNELSNALERMAQGETIDEKVDLDKQFAETITSIRKEKDEKKSA